MRKTLRRSWVMGAVACVPLMSAVAFAGDMKAEGKEKKSCGQHIAAQAPTMEKSAMLMTALADTYAAHAQWAGDSPQAKDEKAALNKVAASYRELAKKMQTVSAQMAMQKDVKDAPHDTKATAKIDKIAQLEMKAAQLQTELAAELDKNAKEMQAAAQQMQSMTGTGGSGASRLEEEDGSAKDDAWPPMPETQKP